jgi:endoribonuclease Dicer
LYLVQLVEQQSDYIRTHTDLTVGIYYGDLGVDLWDKDKWEWEFENHQILVFTAQVFLNLIDHDFFCKLKKKNFLIKKKKNFILALNSVNLIIFDECHHASGDNQYAALMNKHYDSCFDPPRVLGLTASISSRKIKPKDLADDAKELEKTYR